ncbi:hypothetical protein QQP08_008216 [Theobroma cacao]|uniref:Uncharacterized protein n=1 Tax=Theobroma cacao TaxID=3641 RepID=A0A061EHS2_THECC|nr:Uncharacterized protein TCM_011654 [Theobroma cacao]WRX15729.1 hypothetical protein QQP08_008216 [Theobroma cacao]
MCEVRFLTTRTPLSTACGGGDNRGQHAASPSGNRCDDVLISAASDSSKSGIHWTICVVWINPSFPSVDWQDLVRIVCLVSCLAVGFLKVVGHLAKSVQPALARTLLGHR